MEHLLCPTQKVLVLLTNIRQDVPRTNLPNIVPAFSDTKKVLITLTPEACIIKHEGFVMYRLYSKILSLLAQASVCVYPSQKAIAYYEICPFSVNYESVIFYDTGPWSAVNGTFLLQVVNKRKITLSVTKLSILVLFYNQYRTLSIHSA